MDAFTRTYWEEANDGTEGGGGGAAPDRGDEFVPTEGTEVDKTEPVVDKDTAGDEGDKSASDSKGAEDEGDKGTPDAGAEGDKAGTPERDEKGRFIPKSRFDLRTQQLRAAEAELRRLQEENASLRAGSSTTATAASPDFDAQISEVEEKIYAARKDGDIDAERKLAGELRKLERAHFDAKLEAARTETTRAATQNMSLDRMIDDLEAEHPEFDPHSESFDKAKTDQLVELWEAYEARGYPKAQALLKATALLVPEVPEPQPEPSKPAKRTTDVKKNVDAAKKTPPRLDDVGGLDSDKGGIRDTIVPSKLSESDLAALPASTRAKLRGDFL